MSKISKFLLVFFILLSISFNITCAVDLTLSENITVPTSDSNTDNTTTTTTNTTISNVDTSKTNTISSTTVGTIYSLPEANLGLSNILNILLITVGVVLIFLGIAILIKLK